MISSENQDLPEIFTKFSNEKTKEWNDISLTEMLGKFADLKDIDKKDKWNDEAWHMSSFILIRIKIVHLNG